VLFDSHAHLDDDRFADDLDNVLLRAREAGVERILTVGTGIPSCEKALALAAAHSDTIIAAAGIDPHHVDAATEADFEDLAALVAQGQVSALGETGLEYHHSTSDRDAQKRVFERQTTMAVEFDLPLVIHCRDAFEDCFAILRRHACERLRGVAHCFTGGVAEAEEFIRLGFAISFSGIVTFPNAGDIRDAAVAVPADRILIETDCPYLAPVPMRGKRNEPAFVKHVAEKIAEIRGIGVETIARVTSENARRLFGLEGR